MKHKQSNKLIIAALLMVAAASCKKFDAINTNPLAANEDQVQVEYLINSSIVGAQMDPDVAERSFILYWKSGGRQGYEGGTLEDGYVNDGWTTAYFNKSADWQNKINRAVKVGESQISNGTAKLYTSNLIQVARIWRAYLITEFSDNFGPAPLNGFEGTNPTYSPVKDVYYFALAELKEAAAQINLSVESPSSLNNEKIAWNYKYNWEQWQKFANSLRMRLAMRLSEVDAAKAKAEFEDAVSGSKVILNAEDMFSVIENNGWDDLTGVMTRQWNLQMLTASLNNIFTGLGGIPSANQGLPAAAVAKIKPADYIGLKFANHYTTKTNDPTVGYWLDGLPNIIDPRAYKAFIIPGWFNNPDFCNYPTWDNTSTTTSRNLLDDNGNVIKTIDAAYTWNAITTGNWGRVGSKNQVIGFNGTTPTLAMRFRNGTNRRIFFAPWETYFLIAEAAVRGWTVPMSAKAAYEAGIAANFEYWGVSQHLSAYLASTTYSRTGTSVNWEHTTEPGDSYTMNYVDGYTGAAGTVQIKYPVNNLYKNGTVRNDHLTKIITQKFISMLPYLPLEAWNDKRRLGLPFFENPAIEIPLDDVPALTESNYMTSKVEFFPQRLKYPGSLPASNKVGYENALQALGGEDKVHTPLWWALKP
jgi:hypothetical protein